MKPAAMLKLQTVCSLATITALCLWWRIGNAATPAASVVLLAANATYWWLAWKLGATARSARERFDAAPDETRRWMAEHLSGRRIADIKTLREHYGLSLRDAVAVLDAYHANDKAA